MSVHAPRLIVTACSRVDTPWERRADSLTCRCLRPESASNLLFLWGARLLGPVEKTRGANCLRERREREDNSFSCMLGFCVTLGIQKEQSPSLLLINIEYITIRYLSWGSKEAKPELIVDLGLKKSTLLIKFVIFRYFYIHIRSGLLVFCKRAYNGVTLFEHKKWKD